MADLTLAFAKENGIKIMKLLHFMGYYIVMFALFYRMYWTSPQNWCLFPVWLLASLFEHMKIISYDKTEKVDHQDENS